MRITSRRRIALVVGGLTALVAAMAMTMSAGAATKTYNIAYFAPLANTYVQAELVGIGKVLAKNKNVKLTKFDSGFDATKQFNQVQDAITQNKFDGFLLLPLDSVGLVPAAEQAIAAGIKVVSLDTPLGPRQDTAAVQVKGASGSVFDPWTLRAKWLVQLVTKACKGVNPCNVAWMGSVAALPAEKAYRDASFAGMKKLPNVKIIAEVDGGAYTAAGGQKVSQDLITANSDMNVLIANGDQPAAGAVLSLEAAGVHRQGEADRRLPVEDLQAADQGRQGVGLVGLHPRGRGSPRRRAPDQGDQRARSRSRSGLIPTLERAKTTKFPILVTKENVDQALIQYAG